MSYSLDDLRSDMDREFAPLTLEVGGETLVLQNVLRIEDRRRAAVMKALDDLAHLKAKEDGDDLSPEEGMQSVAVVTEILKNVVKDGKGDKLVAAIDGDIPLTMKIMQLWQEATQAGEAESSLD